MSYKNDEVRLIFIENSGNYELMKQNKCFKDYKLLKIPKEIEIAWKDEYIKEQFTKANNQSIGGMELVNSIYGMIISFKDYSDYKKFLSIKRSFLANADLFEQEMYFEKALMAMKTLFESNSHIANKRKTEIVLELESMLIETINKRDYTPNKMYEGITKRYGIDHKTNYIETKLDGIKNEINRIKKILNCDNNESINS